MANNRVLFDDTVTCPHCSKQLTVKAVKECVEEPVKGKYETMVYVDTTTQSTLTEQEG